MKHNPFKQFIVEESLPSYVKPKVMESIINMNKILNKITPVLDQQEKSDQH